MPCTFSCQLPRAVSTSTGIARPASRHCRSTVRPSIFGKPEVEHDGVVSLRSSQELAPLAVRRVIHGIARLAQRAAKLFRQRDFVFDDQNASLLLTLNF